MEPGFAAAIAGSSVVGRSVGAGRTERSTGRIDRTRPKNDDNQSPILLGAVKYFLS
jgi:hypothetical protein